MTRLYSRKFYAFHSVRRFLVCSWTIWLYGRISVYCTILNGSPSSIPNVSNLIFSFALASFIDLFYYIRFRLYHEMFNTCKSIAYFLLLLLLLIRVFHISVSWSSFTGDWMTASFLNSPGHFSVFWPFSIMLLFWWSPLSRQLPNLLGPFIIL